MNSQSLLFLSLLLTTAAHAQQKPALQVQIDRGKTVYDSYCLACHQMDGSGVPQLTPPLIKSTFVAGDKTKLIGIVLNGLQGVEINGETYDNPMPPFEALMDQEIADVLTFVRTNFGNQQPALSKEDVMKTRRKK